MMSLLGSLLGFGTSFLPEVLNFFKAGQEHKQKLETMKLQAELMEKRSALKLQELDKQADIAETKGIYEHDRSIDAGGFVNALRGSVRPVLTYLFFVAFASVKGVLVYAMISNQNIDWVTAVQLAWDDETQAIFSAIIAFWFGNRAMSKARSHISSKKG